MFSSVLPVSVPLYNTRILRGTGGTVGVTSFREASGRGEGTRNEYVDKTTVGTTDGTWTPPGPSGGRIRKEEKQQIKSKDKGPISPRKLRSVCKS